MPIIFQLLISMPQTILASRPCITRSLSRSLRQGYAFSRTICANIFRFILYQLSNFFASVVPVHVPKSPATATAAAATSRTAGSACAVDERTCGTRGQLSPGGGRDLPAVWQQRSQPRAFGNKNIANVHITQHAARMRRLWAVITHCGGCYRPAHTTPHCIFLSPFASLH